MQKLNSSALVVAAAIVLAFCVLVPGKLYADDAAKPAAKVYFTKDISDAGVMKLYAMIKDKVNGKVGLKVHFGEEGNTYYIRPDLMKSLQKQTNATFVETNVIYPGPRRETESHVALAKRHGFDYAPIDILDSEGQEAIAAKVGHFPEVWVGTHFKNYNSYIIFSHYKGHAMAGFGGAIKNVAMGLASATGKISIHASHYPIPDTEKCISCGLCLNACAADAIKLNPIRIDPKKCVGCGKCIPSCPQDVLKVPWNKGDKNAFFEKLSDYALGISSQANMVYISMLTNISPDCDCSGHPDKPFVSDIGVLASTDPVAIDAACLDLVNQAAGSEDAFLDVNSVSGNHQLDYGQQIGLGQCNYTLIDMDKQ